MEAGTLPRSRAAARDVVAATRPADRAGWRALVDASPDATVFQTPEWTDACTSVGRRVDASRMYEMADGRRIVLPAVRAAAGGLATTWSMPYFWGYGGMVSDGPLTSSDVEAVLAYDSELTTTRFVVKPGPGAGAPWRATHPHGRRRHSVHLLDLRPGFDALWSQAFSSSTRNKIRKAEKRGVEVSWGTGAELLGDFWQVYLRWAEQRAEARGIPVRLGLTLARRREPLARFQAMARALGDAFSVILARVDGQPVAATVVLTHGTHAHFWRSASDQAAMGQRYANYLLMARLIEHVASAGYERLDMGESGGVASLAEFKEKFGASVSCYDELRFEPAVVTAALHARERLVDGATGAATAAFGWTAQARERYSVKRTFAAGPGPAADTPRTSKV